MFVVFKVGVLYTIDVTYNGPGFPATYKRLSASAAKHCLRQLMSAHAGNPMRNDCIEIVGSDGSSRHIYP